MARSDKRLERMYEKIRARQGRVPTPGSPILVAQVGRFPHFLAYISEGRIWKGDGSESAALDGARLTVNATGTISKHFSAGRALALGVLGATKTDDARELYLVIEGRDNGFVLALGPDLQSAAHSFASKVNALASGSTEQVAHAEPRDPLAAVSATGNVADELSKLAQLLADGVLTQAEFDGQKAKLLG